MISGTKTELCVRLLQGLGYNLIKYSDLPEPERKEAMETSEYGFIIRRERNLYYNQDQPEPEIVKTLLHELYHITQVSNDEDAAEHFCEDAFYCLELLDTA